MKIGYARVSTVDQNSEGQISVLKKNGCEKIFEDKCSGKSAERPHLTNLMKYAREGDHVFIVSLDRLGRSVSDLRKIIDYFLEKKVSVSIINQNLHFLANESSNPMNDLMFGFLSLIAEYERSLILERQREGIARAKAAGKYRGRKPCITEEQLKEIVYLRNLHVPISRLAKKFRVSNFTIYNYLNKKSEPISKESQKNKIG